MKELLKHSDKELEDCLSEYEVGSLLGPYILSNHRHLNIWKRDSGYWIGTHFTGNSNALKCDTAKEVVTMLRFIEILFY